MDWLDDHINEVILPNLQSEVADLTGIRLDKSLGEFKVVATALDAEEESEEYEITIHFGDLCLVDACFLVEEIESGNLPLCQAPEDLVESLVQAKVNFLREKVVPLLREELAQQLPQHSWDPMLAHRLDIGPELLAPASEMRSSGGYPPMAIVIRHPEFDPDNFEISTRIDPMAMSDWIVWEKLLKKLNQALRAIGEEPCEAPRAAEEPAREPEGPSAADLADTELEALEADARSDAPAPAAPKGGKGGGAAVPDALLAQLQGLLGAIDAADDGEKKGKKAGKKKAAAGKKTASGKKAPPKKAARKASSGGKSVKGKAASGKKAPAGKKPAGKKKAAPTRAKGAKKAAKKPAGRAPSAKKAPAKKKAAKTKAGAKKKASTKKKAKRSGR